MKKLILLVLVTSFLISCGGKSQGDLVGVRGKKWRPEKPPGMALIPGGAFVMGKQDDDFAKDNSTPSKTVTVRSFYMDETEITNSEYRQYVNWVRDSIIKTRLAQMVEDMGLESEPGIGVYGFQDADENDQTAYEKYMYENYYSLDSLGGKRVLSDEDIIWDTEEFPDEYYVEVMDSLYLPQELSITGDRVMDVKKLKYAYTYLDIEAAARAGGNRRDYIKREAIEIYPDTTVWVKDFAYSYNDPMHQDYFWHDAYSDYPVVGVTWKQAKAFCHWRTKFKNDFQREKKMQTQYAFRLPNEAEWEYAARGGLNGGTYPWGGDYTMNDRGCFLANFKPYRGDYAADKALYTVEGKSFEANGYGLYNMAGNVAEWTNTAFNPAAYEFVSSINPNTVDNQNKRKIVRGGSWKDVAYYLKVSTRTYEYQDSARSYIGFRTVQDYMGSDGDIKK